MHLYENTPSMKKYPPLRIQPVKEALTAFTHPSKKNLMRHRPTRCTMASMGELPR
jgi:hypothetical protein